VLPSPFFLLPLSLSGEQASSLEHTLAGSLHFLIFYNFFHCSHGKEKGGQTEKEERERGRKYGNFVTELEI